MRLQVLPALVCTALVTSSALAQEVVGPAADVPPVSDAPMGMDHARRGIQGPAGLIYLRTFLHVNTTRDRVAEPVSLAPDIFFALTDSVQLGLVHNGPMGWQSRPGAGICLGGADGGCQKIYNNVGLDLLLALAHGDVHLSAHGALHFLRIADPNATMATAGLTGKLHFSDAVALMFDPQLGIALNDRSLNEDMLFLPANLQIQLAPPVALILFSGITAELAHLGDTYQIPVGLGLVGNVSERVDLGLRFSFDNLLGEKPPMERRADPSSLSLLMNLRI